MNKFFLILSVMAVLCLCACFPSFAQVFPDDYVSHVWTAADGLPGNTITDIIQNRDGYIYIGTYDGLVRFDGIEFTIMNRNTMPDFKCVSARAVYEDSRGLLWVGSNDEGVACIDGSKITMYTLQSGLPNNSIRDITEDNVGNIWIGTAGGVVYISRDGAIHKPAGLEQYGETNLLVQYLFCDSAGRIWMVTTKAGGLYYYKSGAFFKYVANECIQNNPVTAIAQDATGAFWFGISNGGAIRIENNEETVFNEGTALENTSLNDIYRDKNGNMWFGTETGVFLYRDGKFFKYSEKQGLSNNNVQRILEDREGNLWFATARGGVEKMNMGKFRTITLDETVNSIAEAADGFVWMGTDTGLLCLDKDFSHIENELTEMCRGLRIRHVAVAKNGDILVSAYAIKGQIRAGKNGIQNWTTENGLAGDKVRVAVETTNGDLYVGTTTGLSVIHSNGSIKNFTIKDGLNNDYIMCIYEDDDHRMWVGTDGGGINIIENEQVVSSFTTENKLAGNVVFKIMQDDDGVYWICTGSGISRYDEKTFYNYTSACGLGTDAIFQTLIDYTGNVLMTSNRGISSIPYETFTEFMTNSTKLLDPAFFNRNDGLRSGGITSTSLSMIDSLGRVWFTLIDGFAIYDPVKIKANKNVPLVHVEAVSIDDKPFENFDGTIRIAPGSKRIDIKYTGLSFSSPDKMRFKYKLEGFDAEYSEPVSVRSVSFTNLKPGSYAFRVLASNGDELWSEYPASVSLIQLPYFWQRPLFWIICAVITVAGIIVFIYVRERRMRLVQLQLETMVQQRTVELEIEKDKSDCLLLNILPAPIAERLKEHGDKTIADRYEEATVLFSDIVGFTTISSKVTAQEIVSALNSLFSRFDERAQAEGIEKIKTIGDAYMAVCGVPEPNSDHAVCMIRFAQGMYEDLADYNKTSAIQFNIRIGLNSGSVIAGVIGQTKFIYDLWGDTVNVASRMESLCTPGRIMVTDAVRTRAFGNIRFTDEEEHDVKGKGRMKTFMVQ